MLTANQQAVYLAKYFFLKTGRRATGGLMAQAVGQAKHLLTAGFSLKEIEQGVEWFITHPPKNGFNSLGWLSYGLNDALVKIKAQQAKEQMNNTEMKPMTTPEVQRSAKTSEERVSKDFDFDMFK
jgi:hypothetical protein